MRTASISRTTAETDISLKLSLDGMGMADISTGCGFLDHMLTLFAKHAHFNLSIACKGDTQVDDHHTVEDVGIALGQALKDALGDLRGVTRFGDCALPMDEALVMAAVDLSGRDALGFAADLPSQKVGTFDTELVKEFFLALTREACITLHLRQLAGENTHHILEAMFKGAARALRQAVTIDPDFQNDIPSTKGTLGGKA
ncbi:MAG: imidazoleglycerol-phosphate dehydratase HisB [Clostridiales bacterium]|nr:imidazoleglycerol-phosphate dehydratase HisB [Clostridiales bacterium]